MVDRRAGGPAETVRKDRVKGARLFVTRIGDRVVQMGRAALVAAFQRSAASAQAEAERQERFEEQFRQCALAFNGLTMMTAPAEPRPGVDGFHRSAVEEWMNEPEATGNRRSGWNFLVYSQMTPMVDGFECGDPEARSVESGRDGRILVQIGLERLPGIPPPKNLSPFALLDPPPRSHRS